MMAPSNYCLVEPVASNYCLSDMTCSHWNTYGSPPIGRACPNRIGPADGTRQKKFLQVVLQKIVCGGDPEEVNEIGRSDFCFEASAPHSRPGGARWLENRCLHAKATSVARTLCCKALKPPGAPRSRTRGTTKARIGPILAFSP